MKKISMTFLVAGVLVVTGVRAQSLQEGINDLYAERFKSAKATFEKLLAANPNNIEATYWLGQNYIATRDIPGARDVYSKALLASANAPLIIVGMGQVELNEKKTSEATQRFEAAITMTRGKKGDDPAILNAVGRAIVNTYTDKEKVGDINYGLAKLEAASQRDPNSAEIFLNLGNAYLKAKPGEGGGKAFESYNKAIAVNPGFAPPYYRLGKLFYYQRNWELFEEWMAKAIAHDPKFAPAYYELSYYKLARKDLATAESYAQKFKENADADPQNAYLEASIKWANKNYNDAINMAKDIIAKSNGKAKPRVYKLVADAMVQKGDTAAAKPYIDEYFARATADADDADKVTALDYKLKADICSGIPGQEDCVYNSYLDGVKADTVIDNKVELLKQGAAFFKSKGQREKEGDMWATLVEVKPKPTLNDYFEATRAYYFGQNYQKSMDMAKIIIEKYPTEIYGYTWQLNNAKVLDSTFTLNMAVPAATQLLELAQKDTAKYKKDLIGAASFLATYYANEAKDAAKAIEYLQKIVDVDPSNLQAKDNIEKIKKSQQQPATPPRRNTPPKSGNSSSNNNNKQSAGSTVAKE